MVLCIRSSACSIPGRNMNCSGDPQSVLCIGTYNTGLAPYRIRRCRLNDKPKQTYLETCKSSALGGMSQ